MSKICLNVTMRVIVDADVNEDEDIMEYLDCYAEGDNTHVMVLEHEVQDYTIEDAK